LLIALHISIVFFTKAFDFFAPFDGKIKIQRKLLAEFSLETPNFFFAFKHFDINRYYILKYEHQISLSLKKASLIKKIARLVHKSLPSSRKNRK
jgi:hypothetical protein